MYKEGSPKPKEAVSVAKAKQMLLRFLTLKDAQRKTL